jgi:hypothetical protein
MKLYAFLQPEPMGNVVSGSDDEYDSFWCIYIIVKQYLFAKLVLLLPWQFAPYLAVL